MGTCERIGKQEIAHLIPARLDARSNQGSSARNNSGPARARSSLRVDRCGIHSLPQPRRESRRIESHRPADPEAGNATVMREFVDLAFADREQRRNIGHSEGRCPLFKRILLGVCKAVYTNDRFATSPRSAQPSRRLSQLISHVWRTYTAGTEKLHVRRYRR
jgi:hypothetical protein